MPYFPHLTSYTLHITSYTLNTKPPNSKFRTPSEFRVKPRRSLGLEYAPSESRLIPKTLFAESMLQTLFAALAEVTPSTLNPKC